MKKQLFFNLVLFSWVLILIVSYIWNIKTTEKNTLKIITKQSAAFFEEIETTRLWNANHGGVYVPIDENTQPNPYLEVPNRDIYIDSLGLALTKVNPAFMTRQIAELARTNSQIQYHITSRKPIRPANKARKWEEEALRSFKKESDYSLYLYEDDTSSVYRYMAPLFVKKGCLQCHAKQGYHLGDLRGGISVSTPAKTFLEAESLQKRNINLFHFVSLFVGVISLFLFRRYSRKQYSIVLRKNEQIQASINYASTIQAVVLPRKKIIDQFFDSFILFKPKDVVSGDFYWFKHLENKNSEAETSFFAAVDCTGHGIPGAFMSMIGIQLLNKIVSENRITSPADILAKLNRGIRWALKQDATQNRDGMDVCLCRLEKQADGTTKLTFSGAKLPLFLAIAKKNAEIAKIPIPKQHIFSKASSR